MRQMNGACLITKWWEFLWNHPFNTNEQDELREIDLTEVFEAFPTMRVYAFCHRKLRELLPTAQWGSLVSIAEFYPFTDGA